MGCLDVEDYLAQLSQEDSAWTCDRIAEFTGIPSYQVREAIRRGRLVTSGRDQIASVEALVRWLEDFAPPYRAEVAHLSPLLSSKVAGKVSKLGQTQVVKAIRADRLRALAVEAATGIRYYIPRRNLDVWLIKQGLPPSWKTPNRE